MKHIKHYKKFKYLTVILAIIAVLVVSLLPNSTVFASTPGSVSGWNTTTSLPSAMEGTGSAEYNGYIYVAGGGVDTIEYAKINADGSIGSWTTSANLLPQAEGFQSVQAYNGYLYSFGGRDVNWTNSVYYAPINADGSVGSWSTTTSLPQNLTQNNTVIYDGYVYNLGGNNNDNQQNTIYIAPINADGSIGSWSTSSSIVPTYGDSATTTIFDGYLYLISGQNCTLASDGGTCYQNLAYSVPLGPNGYLGTWNALSNLPPLPVFAQGYTVQNGYIFTVGGEYYNGSAMIPVNSVYSAPLGPNGYLGTWNTQTSLPETIYGQSSVAYNGNLYVIGGTTSGVGSGTVSTVYYTTVYGALAANSPTSLGPSAITNDSYTNNNQPTFTFSQSDPNSPTPNVQYEFEVSTNSNYSSPVIDYTSTFGSVGNATFTVGQAAGSGTYNTGSAGQTLPDGSYYWRVRTINSYLVASGFTDASSSLTAFQVDTTPPTVPGAPTTTSPTTDTAPTWTWAASTDSGSGLATTPYTVEWSQDSTFSSGVSSSTSSTTLFTQTPALSVGIWYFRVKAADVAGNYSAYSTVASVTIQAPPVDVNPPNTPSSTGTPSSYVPTQQITQQNTPPATNTQPAAPVAPSPNNVLLNDSQDFTSGAGKRVNLTPGQNVRFSVNNTPTNITVQSVGADYVTLQLGTGSNSRMVTLRTGETDQYAIAGSGKPNISVSLIGTSNGTAELSFSEIKLASVTVTLSNQNKTHKISKSIYWVVALIIIAVFLFLWIVAARRRRKKHD